MQTTGRALVCVGNQKKSFSKRICMHAWFIKIYRSFPFVKCFSFLNLQNLKVFCFFYKRQVALSFVSEIKFIYQKLKNKCLETANCISTIFLYSFANDTSRFCLCQIIDIHFFLFSKDSFVWGNLTSFYKFKTYIYAELCMHVAFLLWLQTTSFSTNDIAISKIMLFVGSFVLCASLEPLGSPYYSAVQTTIPYYSVLQSTSPYFKVLQSTVHAPYHKLLRFTVRILLCEIMTSTLENVQNYMVFFHVVSHAWFYMGNWGLHCFVQCKMHFRFLPNYFDLRWCGLLPADLWLTCRAMTCGWLEVTRQRIWLLNCPSISLLNIRGTTSD